MTLCPVESVEEFVTLLRGDEDNTLFHTTDERNLHSIAEHGLLSKTQLNAQQIEVFYPGGSGLTWALDEAAGLNDYVFLSFTRSPLMPKHDDDRYRRPRLIQVDPSIILLPGVRIALGCANHRDTRSRRAKYAIPDMDWQILLGDFDRNDISFKARWNTVCNYEVLVPRRVPAEYLS